MKKVICIILVCIVIILPFCVSADVNSSTTSIVVNQYNPSYSGWSNTSPTHYGALYSGSNLYPISLAGTNSNLSAIGEVTVSPQYVDVYVTDPNIINGATVYIALCNTYGVFTNNTMIDTYFSWEDSIPGYKAKYSASTSLGYFDANQYGTYTNPSSFSVQYSCMKSGSTSTSSSGTATSVSTLSMQRPTVVNEGNTYQQFYRTSSSNNMRLLRVTINKPSTQDASQLPDTVRFRYDANDLVKYNIAVTSNSSYLHSAIFIPYCFVIPNTGDFDTEALLKLDNIITYLTNIDANVDGISIDVGHIVSYLADSNYSVITALEAILNAVEDIDNGVQAVTGNQYASAIQYIEFYLEQVLDNTDTIVNQMDSIIATLNSISNTIGATNMDAINNAQNAEDVHTYEATLYTAANTSIASTVMNNYSFDSNTASGLALVGSDFTSLWGAIRQYNIVYTFSMTLALAFTIIRYVRSSPKPKKEKGNTQ